MTTRQLVFLSMKILIKETDRKHVQPEITPRVKEKCTAKPTEGEPA